MALHDQLYSLRLGGLTNGKTSRKWMHPLYVRLMKLSQSGEHMA
jgi:hypothetical protein